MTIAEFDALDLASLGGQPFSTLLADPPWRFRNRAGKIAPEHKRLARYDTLSWEEIASMPVADVMSNRSHCYLWVSNALLAEGMAVLEACGFTYKTMLVWAKGRKDGGTDGRGVGFNAVTSVYLNCVEATVGLRYIHLTSPRSICMSAILRAYMIY